MRCYYCGDALVEGCAGKHTPSNTKTKDHVIPAGLLKKHSMSISMNLVESCRACNQDKGGLTAGEYRVVLAYRAGIVKTPDLCFANETTDELRIEQLLLEAL